MFNGERRSLNRENILEGQRSKSFQKKREEERKASEASGNTRAWNSLFMRPDTVCHPRLLLLSTCLDLYFLKRKSKKCIR